MPTLAVTRGGQSFNAEDVPAHIWEQLQLEARPGDYLMPCCGANAALKVSPLGFQFFAHFSGECGTAPETAWHREGKLAVANALRRMGLHPIEEVSGRLGRDSWRADIAVDAGTRRLAFELQRSPQTLKDFLKRQQRYTGAGVEAYWLAPQKVFLNCIRAGSRLKVKRDWGGVLPPVSFGFLPELPIALLSLELRSSVDLGGLERLSLQDWVAAVVEGRYRYDGARWTAA